MTTSDSALSYPPGFDPERMTYAAEKPPLRETTEELRLAYRILKNAGYVPPEVSALNEIAELERFVAAGEADVEAQSKALRRLALLKTRVEARYYRQVLGKLSR